MGRAQEQLGAMGQLSQAIAQGQQTGLRGRQLAQEGALAGLKGQMGVGELQQRGSMGTEELRARMLQAGLGTPSGTESLISGATGLAGLVFGKK
jgi:hypothetical protein